MTFRCVTCGQEHEGLPDLGMLAPDPYLDVPEAERAERTTFTPDRCTEFFSHAAKMPPRGAGAKPAPLELRVVTNATLDRFATHQLKRRPP
jgi:hypothetical protein